MDSKLSRLCDGLIEAGWLVAIVTVPLFFNIHSDRIFEPDKLTLLRAVAVVMALAWVVKAVDGQAWQRLGEVGWRGRDAFWRQPLVLPVLALVVIYLVSNALSVTPHVSFFGSYQRLQGTYTTLAYIVIFGLMVGTIRSRAQVGRVVTAVIITSIPVAFYGVLQHYGLDPLPWGGDVTKRVAGSLGNSIFIAAYLIMAVPLTLARILDAFTSILSDEHLSTSDVIRAAIYIFALFIQLLSIYWSGSRGPLLALLTGLFAFILVLLVSLRNAAAERGAFRAKEGLLALALVVPSVVALLLANVVRTGAGPLAAFLLFVGTVGVSVLLVLLLMALRRGWRWLWLSWILLSLFGAVWLLLFNLPEERLAAAEDAPLAGGVAQTLVAWKELPAIGTYGRMLDPTQTEGREKSNRVRVLIWDGVVDLISPHAPLEYPDGRTDIFNFWRPLLGYGPESMYVAYNRYYPPELATVEVRNASPDRSHNETFDALVITGFLGFLAWQALYVSVFYLGFRYLGVVGSRRDRNLLIGLWVAGAALGAALSYTVFDPIYLGVAVPTGTIVALLAYLIYYALFTEGDEGAADVGGRARPFQPGRLLMNALLAGVIVHYVEIHFGIAISATRLHFFIYIALMFLVSYRLPRLERAAEPAPRRRRTRESGSYVPAGLWGSIWAWALLLALLVGTLGFSFTNYALPPDKLVETPADLTAGEIFRQSLFVNPQNGFVESPFIFLLLVLSWALGCLLVLSEMVKSGEFSFEVPALRAPTAARERLAAVGLALLALAGVTLLFTALPGSTLDFVLQAVVVLLWAGLTLGPAWLLLRDHAVGRLTAVSTGALAVVLALPLLVAGQTFLGVVTAVLGAGVLVLLWDSAWRDVILPPLALGLASLSVGLAYTFVQAVLLRESLLYLLYFQGIEPVSTLYRLFFRAAEEPESIAQVRVWDAMQAARYLSVYYAYTFALLALSGLALARRAVGQAASRASLPGVAAALTALVVGVLVINATNVEPVQADMIFKRGRAYEDQATLSGDPATWDAAIAVYEKAREMVPNEDYYYLFLGRSYLERAAVAVDPQERAALLRTAEDRLLDAQRINPLNTDHTANLARLNTRWLGTATDDATRTERLRAAEDYYQAALALSPQNSIIRNEYARLAHDLKGDCEQAINLFNRSLEIDPFYVVSYLARADVLAACAATQTDQDVAQALRDLAVDSLAEGLAREPDDVRAWLQASQIYQRIGRFDLALGTIDEAERRDVEREVPLWNYAYLRALAYRDAGDLQLARQAAARARSLAPPDVVPQIDVFVEQLDSLQETP